MIFRESSKLAYELGSDTQFYFYSYWSDDVAIGLGMLQNKFPELITFSRVHRWDLYFEESEFGYLPYRTFLVNSIGRIFSISQDGIEYIRDYWKEQDMSKIVLSRLGVSNSHPFRLSNNEIFTLVSCSNLIKVKRVDLIAKALGEIDDIKIKWVHFGDGVCREMIEEFIQNMPDAISVELKGSVSNKEIYAYYAKLKPDLFINVSSSEGVPVSIMEAMSFGIPVIATDVGGNGEIVNQKNGFLLHSSASIEEIAECILNFARLEKLDIVLYQNNSFSTWFEKYNSKENYLTFLRFVMEI
ncbi:MAG: glycosyltransferase [Crocinitomicaceae bacterium]